MVLRWNYWGLRYRERYGLLQRLLCSLEGGIYHGYDTANGMDCCNITLLTATPMRPTCYDTANGMDCCNTKDPVRGEGEEVRLRYRERYGLLQRGENYSETP